MSAYDEVRIVNEENPFSSPQERSTVKPSPSLAVVFRQVVFDLLGYGTLVAFSCFLLFSAQRYHSVYGWAHGQGRNISPEQFYQSANFANNTILLVVAICIYFVVRSPSLVSKIIGGICTVACFVIFLQGCGAVGTRF